MPRQSVQVRQSAVIADVHTSNGNQDAQPFGQTMGRRFLRDSRTNSRSAKLREHADLLQKFHHGDLCPVLHDSSVL
jgi:hypothetical protein